MSISRLEVGYARGRRALRVWGLRATARESIRYVRRWPARQRWADLDQAFDREHGVDTAGIVPLQALAIDSAKRDLGHRYHASDAAGFRALMARLALPAEELTFVDLGAGKGRAMLLASELPFRRVVGVEFAPELCEVARRNVKSSSPPRSDAVSSRWCAPTRPSTSCLTSPRSFTSTTPLRSRSCGRCSRTSAVPSTRSRESCCLRWSTATGRFFAG